MELQAVNSVKNTNIIGYQDGIVSETPFIESNTKEISLEHLRRDCTIPVFAKDNEITISHQDFIESTWDCVRDFYPQQEISNPKVRASHIIKGRTPQAIRKPASELLPNEKTIYYERCAFVIELPSIIGNVGGDTLSLAVGGVRAYNQENLYSKKSLEKFKIFIGFKNWVCTNLCVSTDGFSNEIRVSSIIELKEQINDLISNYNIERHLSQMSSLQKLFLTEKQFAQLLGKARLYQHLPKEKKRQLPLLSFNDSQLNTIAKDYYEDSSFCRNEEGNISLWNVYNLFTGANKSSYIDSFLERNVNAYTFTNSIADALKSDGIFHWFLS